ncbi:MAG: DUF502 domain-containing protein [Vicinamibacteraceae bacterium]|nr:DUF502 domain-containing protein [Vicinamibacteraceae bacterium]
MSWLRRSFITGFFVTVPLVISVAAFVWSFAVVDGLLGPWFTQWLGREVPGLGILATALGVLVVGAVANNVFGKRVLQRAEFLLLKVPLFRTVYAPVKQLVAAFSPDNETGFKRVVLVDDPHRGMLLGFLTREFTLEGAGGERPARLAAVYVPTNHLYLGDVLVFRESAISYPDLSVEEGIRIFLTGGMAISPRVRIAAMPAPGAPREGPSSGPGSA